MNSNPRASFLTNCLLESLEDQNYENSKKLITYYKADVNLVLTSRGIAPIHYAAGMENSVFGDAIMMVMLKNGGNPNVKTTDGETPLHIAAIWNHEIIVEILLDHGGDLSIKDSDGHTPINNAILERNFNLIPLFQNYVFESKIEKRNNQMQKKIQKNQIAPYLEHISDTMHRLSIPKNYNELLTPNKTNFNFKESSPFFINITQRRRKQRKNPESVPGHNQNEKGAVDVKKGFRRTISVDPEIENEVKRNAQAEIECINLSSDDEEVDIVENLFQLTEENMEKHLEMAPKKNRISLVNTWRNKVNKSRARATLVPHNETELDSFVSRFIEDNDSASSNTQTTKIAKPTNNANQLLATPRSMASESFITADDQLDDTYVLNTNKGTNTVVQMEENYMHTDTENDVVFFERKYLPNPVMPSQDNNYEDDNGDDVISIVTTETDFSVPLDYDTDTLRKDLTHIGVVAGPITKNTKRLYLKRLVRHRRQYPQGIPINERVSKPKNFSVELVKTLRDENAENYSEIISSFEELEKQMICGFSSCQGKVFREGNLKTSFNYLLIDPLISENLPGESRLISKHETWKRFVSSIFYVGKGKSSRPYAHLYDAIKMYKEKPINVDLKTKQQDSLKLDRINDIWRAGKGVICLPVFHNIMPVEAYTREAAIIDCLGVENLTNCKRGDYYGTSKSWTMRQRKQLGVLLLFKGLHIFLAEGESQLRPDDIQPKKPKKN